jgi:hypothetical protein
LAGGPGSTAAGSSRPSAARRPRRRRLPVSRRRTVLVDANQPGLTRRKESEEAAHRPVGTDVDLLGVGHRQHAEQPPDLVVADRLAAIGSIAGLAALKLTMLAALFAGVPPHPPQELAPLFGSALALSVLSVALIQARSRWFLAPTAVVAVESLVSYGPHKLFVGQSVAIYPAVLVGSALVLVLGLAGWRLSRAFAPSAPEGDLTRCAAAAHSA